MKRTTWIIIAIAGGLVLQAAAAGTDNAPSATTTTSVKKSTLQQRMSQFFLEPKTTKTYKIDRVGGISSRPWAQTAGWASEQVQFAGDRERYNEPKFNLFWLGATPQ